MFSSHSHQLQPLLHTFYTFCSTLHTCGLHGVGAPRYRLNSEGCHQCLGDEWTSKGPEWSQPPLKDETRVPAITGVPGSQVDERIPITSSPMCLCCCSKHRKIMSCKGPDHFRQLTCQNAVYIYNNTQYLRTVSFDQHWGISPRLQSQRMRVHMLEESQLPSGESLRKCHLMHYKTISQGGFWGQEPTRGMQIPVFSLWAHTGLVVRQTCFLTALMYQCIA